jgi:hypothetical protein
MVASVSAVAVSKRPESTVPTPGPRASGAAARRIELASDAEAGTEFRLWYRDAAEELKAGRKDVVFPPGCFPRLAVLPARATAVVPGVEIYFGEDDFVFTAEVRPRPLWRSSRMRT